MICQLRDGTVGVLRDLSPASCCDSLVQNKDSLAFCGGWGAGQRGVTQPPFWDSVFSSAQSGSDQACVHS